MPKRTTISRYILVVAVLLLLLISNITSLAASKQQRATKLTSATGYPQIDPNYIYDQLYYMATHYLIRWAGYDHNGHDGFATYWTNEILKNLQGFGPTVKIDKFPVQGWPGYPPTEKAFNVEVTVPGVVHPEQVVVIGCHYDGAFSVTQSANDDGSGCAIELGIAKAMAAYWSSQHVYPARTLRFVIFDAEEQGLFGSFHYLNDTINGDVNNVVSMFNEEQNGIAYPLRYLGDVSNPLLPFQILMSPLTNNPIYPHQDKLTKEQRENIKHFRALMQQAIPAVFAQFRQMGYTQLIYHNSSGKQITQQIFTPQHTRYVQPLDDNLGSSDQVPFTLAGLPCATFLGNHSYYDPNPPPWSYPFDTPQDKIQLMNTFANGNAQKAPALVLALAVPAVFTTWMLTQPSILGQAPATSNPIAAISDIGQPKVKTSIALDAKASFDPNGSQNLTYAWDFGDGNSASGIAVSHTYTKIGTYTLTLTVTSPDGQTVVTKILNIVLHPKQYPNPY